MGKKQALDPDLLRPYFKNRHYRDDAYCVDIEKTIVYNGEELLGLISERQELIPLLGPLVDMDR
jgi:hypothetical protein